MLFWRKIYFNLLNLVLHFLVKSKLIPSDPIKDLRLDLARPILYILPYNSKIDLLTLRIQCLIHDLPDPFDLLKIDGKVLPSYLFISDILRLIRYDRPNKKLLALLYEYIDLYHSHPHLNIQILPVLVMLGRSPGREGTKTSHLRLLKSIKKLFYVLWLGRDSFIRFSNPVSLRSVILKYNKDKGILQKLARVAGIHFTRQRLAAVGPKLPIRQDQFNKLMTVKVIKKSIEDEAHTKKISFDIAKQHVIELIKEIAADVSYEAIRLSDRILSLIWNRLYQDINVTNAGRVQQLAQYGHKIVYVPCHRSHMDYFLVSYVLYQQGLVPPHIAAGINLNFWPAGTILRRLGAFFIRRTFKRNKLYSTVFREYLADLFTRGYSIEYFIEGRRSRTGRLLEPKTGTLSMTIQAILRSRIRQITLVPIYIGYEQVIEVGAYAKELHGASKKREGLLQMLCGLRKIRKLGHCYINFGDPILLTAYLNQHVPQWLASLDLIEVQRPNWITPTVKHLAEKIMIRINNAAAVNAINLCATVLLAAQHYSLTKEQLIEQLACYLQLIRNVPYSHDVTVPTQTPDELLDHAISLHQFSVKQDSMGDVILLSRDQAELMTYYRNNIHHLLVIPSVIATIVMHHRKVLRSELLWQIHLIYPMLKAELFLHYEKEQLVECLYLLIKEMIRQNLIYSQDEDLVINPYRISSLQLLAAGVSETLQRYLITISILIANPSINRYALEKKSYLMAQRLSIEHDIHASEFLDKEIFATLVKTLREEGYLNETGDMMRKNVLEIYIILCKLMTEEIRQTIENINVSI